ncbi:MAG TPA: S4 domain-containing protein, partial [Chthoniobacterales bacterium]|nr:S4 domain-containing protein [Chthoniobacterales bacterium]
MSTSATKKMRLDNLLVARGFFDSRERAQRAIMAGDVRIAERSVSKASELVAPNASISIAHRRQYASRGALKLAGVLDSFQIEVA